MAGTRSADAAPQWTGDAQTVNNLARGRSEASREDRDGFGDPASPTGSEDVLARLDALLGLVPAPGGQPSAPPQTTGTNTAGPKAGPTQPAVPAAPTESKEDRYAAMSVEDLKGILRKRDDTEALYALSLRYAEGLGVNEDPAEASRLLEKAARLGSAKAQRKLGSHLVGATGEERNLNEAVKWLGKAAEQGDAEAQFKLSLLHWTRLGNRNHFSVTGEPDQRFFAGLQKYHIDQTTGRQDHGLELDDSETVRWAQKATERDYPRAWLLLGYCHDEGVGVEKKDSQKAVECFRRAADHGDPDAQYQLACHYRSGDGVAEDRGEAMEWAEKSAGQNHVEAQRFLGMAYLEGNGLEQDREKAVEWLSKSAEKRDVPSMYLLGISFHEGLGVDQDHRQAFEWLRRAAKQDHPEAQLALGTLYENGDGVQKNLSEAVKWYLKAADRGMDGCLGHAEAQYRLGCCYYAAEGVPYDCQKAKLWFRRAADKDHAKARKALATKNFQD